MVRRGREGEEEASGLHLAGVQLWVEDSCWVEDGVMLARSAGRSTPPLLLVMTAGCWGAGVLGCWGADVLGENGKMRAGRSCELLWAAAAGCCVQLYSTSSFPLRASSLPACLT
jgi:hypothetical protein